MKTTLKRIRAAKPCGMALEDGEREGYLKLRHFLGKGYGDNKTISIATVIDSNGIDDAIWCLGAVRGHDREIRLFGVWCANQVRHLMAHESSTNALDVSERFANGAATGDELAAAWAAASGAARDAAWGAARGAARDAAWAAAWGAAWAAAWGAARDAAWAAAWGAARDAAWDAARGAARDAAWDAARAAQAEELRRVCACVDAGIDPYPSGTRGELPQPTKEVAA